MGRGMSYSEGDRYRDFAEWMSENVKRSKERAWETFVEENKEFFDNLTDEDRDLIKWYSGGKYEYINENIRENDDRSKLDEKVARLVDIYREAIKNSTLKYNTLFHRYSGMAFLTDLGLNLDPKMSVDERVNILNSVKGTTFVNKGFTSSGTHHERHFGPVHYEILTPKGSNFGAFIAPMSHFPEESEYMFGDHVRYQLVGARNVGGRLTVRIKAVKQDKY